MADPFGHELSFTYNSAGQIATLTDASGALYSYAYTGSTLTSVSYPNSTTRQYYYNESAETGGVNLPYALTGIIDEAGTRFATISYNSSGQATHPSWRAALTILGLDRVQRLLRIRVQLRHRSTRNAARISVRVD